MSAKLNGRNEQELKQLEKSWDEAVARRDADSLSHLVADDYHVTDLNGEIHDKSKVMQAVTSVEPQLKPYRRDDVDVQIDGDKAVVTGRITWGSRNGGGNGKGNARVRARYLKVYVKRDDGWKALVARATRIAEH